MMGKSKPNINIYPWLLRPHAFAFDDDATGFVFRSAMNLERHGSLKRKKKVKAVGYLTPTPCLTIFHKARPYLVVATYGLISKCANIAIRVSYHRRVITMFWVLGMLFKWKLVKPR